MRVFSYHFSTTALCPRTPSVRCHLKYVHSFETANTHQRIENMQGAGETAYSICLIRRCARGG